MMEERLMRNILQGFFDVCDVKFRVVFDDEENAWYFGASCEHTECGEYSSGLELAVAAQMCSTRFRLLHKEFDTSSIV